LENSRSDKIEAFGRVRILEERLKEQTDRLQSESKRSQEILVSQRELFREHEALKSMNNKLQQRLESSTAELCSQFGKRLLLSNTSCVQRTILRSSLAAKESAPFVPAQEPELLAD